MRLAVVTGASRGLGRAIALAMAASGDEVAVGWHRAESEAVDVVAAIVAAGGRAFPFHVDVTGDVDVAFERLVAEHRPVDVLVNNAGVASDGWFATSAAEDWRAVLDVNLRGTEACCRAVARGMIARRQGVIVNVGSVAGQRGGAGQTAYATSKAAIVGFTRALAQEVAPRGLRVNAVVPGLLDVGIAARMDRRAHAEKLARVPMGRVGTGAEIANVVVFLASDLASYVTGQAIAVDGGVSL